MNPEYQPRVLYVDHTAELGGAELGLFHIAAMTRLRLQVGLLSEGRLADQLRAAGHPPEVLTGSNITATLRLLRHRLLRRDFDLVVTNTLRATVLVSLLAPRNTPHVAYVQDDLGKAALPFHKRLLARLALRRCVHVLANSDFTRGTVRNLGVTCDVDTIYSISGAPQQLFDDRRNDIGQSPRLRVVFAGRMVPWKGPDFVLRAIERALLHLGPDSIEVVMCGSPIMGPAEYYERTVKYAERLPATVHFVGFVDVMSYLVKSDVLIHASRRPEPFGQVVVQAAAAGICVVAPDMGGPLEILGNVARDVVFKSGDIDSLAQRVVELARDRDRLADAARAVQHAGKAFADERMIELHDRTLASIVQRRTGGNC